MTFLDEGFSPASDEWGIAILNRFKQQVGECRKDDCLIDTEGNFYITVRAEAGRYYAKTTYQMPDSDYESGFEQRTDIQPLYDTGCGCLPKQKPCWCEEEAQHRVTFEQVFIQNVDGLLILLDRDGNPILDRNGEAILVHKYKQTAETGE